MTDQSHTPLMAGEKFGRLTTVEVSGTSGKWLCSCDCGGAAIVSAARLRSGNNRSCGCLRIEALAKTTVQRVARSAPFVPTPAYIEEKSIPEPNSGCWLWLGATANRGYGQATIGRSRVTSAHRASFIAYRGYEPVGLDVDHLCRNPICVNPDHLEAVTHQENCRRRHSALSSYRGEGK